MILQQLNLWENEHIVLLLIIVEDTLLERETVDLIVIYTWGHWEIYCKQCKKNATICPKIWVENGDDNEISVEKQRR